MHKRYYLKKWLSQLQEILNQEEKLNEALKDMSLDFGGFANQLAVETILEILKEISNDDEDWISYYIFDLDWGRHYYPGCVLDAEGKEIPLKSIDDLLNLIGVEE